MSKCDQLDEANLTDEQADEVIRESGIPCSDMEQADKTQLARLLLLSKKTAAEEQSRNSYRSDLYAETVAASTAFSATTDDAEGINLLSDNTSPSPPPLRTRVSQGVSSIVGNVLSYLPSLVPSKPPSTNSPRGEAQPVRPKPTAPTLTLRSSSIPPSGPYVIPRINRLTKRGRELGQTVVNNRVQSTESTRPKTPNDKAEATVPKKFDLGWADRPPSPPPLKISELRRQRAERSTREGLPHCPDGEDHHDYHDIVKLQINEFEAQMTALNLASKTLAPWMKPMPTVRFSPSEMAQLRASLAKREGREVEPDYIHPASARPLSQDIFDFNENGQDENDDDDILEMSDRTDTDYVPVVYTRATRRKRGGSSTGAIPKSNQSQSIWFTKSPKRKAVFNEDGDTLKDSPPKQTKTEGRGQGAKSTSEPNLLSVQPRRSPQAQSRFYNNFTPLNRLKRNSPLNPVGIENVIDIDENSNDTSTSEEQISTRITIQRSKEDKTYVEPLPLDTIEESAVLAEKKSNVVDRRFDSLLESSGARERDNKDGKRQFKRSRGRRGKVGKLKKDKRTKEKIIFPELKILTIRLERIELMPKYYFVKNILNLLKNGGDY